MATEGVVVVEAARAAVAAVAVALVVVAWRLLRAREYAHVSW